jgi:hypothetical protein
MAGEPPAVPALFTNPGSSPASPVALLGRSPAAVHHSLATTSARQLFGIRPAVRDLGKLERHLAS